MGCFDARLARVEQTNRRLFGAVVLLSTIIVVMIGAGADKAEDDVVDVLRARSIEILDDRGDRKVLLMCDGEEGLMRIGGTADGPAVMIRTRKDGAGVTVFGPSGEVAAALDGGDGGGEVSTSNTSGKLAVLLSSVPSGEGRIFVSDGKGQPIVRLGPMQSGEGSIETLNPSGKALVTISASEKDVGAISTFDGKGTELAHLGGSARDGGALRLSSIDGKCIFFAGSENGAGTLWTTDDGKKALVHLSKSADGGGELHVIGPAGKGRAGIGAGRFGGGMIITNRDGNEVVKAGCHERGYGIVVAADSGGKPTESLTGKKMSDKSTRQPR